MVQKPVVQDTSEAAGILNSAEGLGQLQAAEVGTWDHREIF